MMKKQANKNKYKKYEWNNNQINENKIEQIKFNPKLKEMYLIHNTKKNRKLLKKTNNNKIHLYIDRRIIVMRKNIINLFHFNSHKQ